MATKEEQQEDIQGCIHWKFVHARLVISPCSRPIVTHLRQCSACHLGGVGSLAGSHTAT